MSSDRAEPPGSGQRDAAPARASRTRDPVSDPARRRRAPAPATELRRQIARLERSSRSSSPRPSRASGIEWDGRRRPAGPACSASGSWSGSATRWRPGSPTSRGGSSDRAYVETQNRELLEQMLAEPAASSGADLQRGHRRARLPPLALAPALGPAGDADGLVAGQALLRLPVMTGAPRRGARDQDPAAHIASGVAEHGEEPQAPPQAPPALRAPPRRSCHAPPRPSATTAKRGPEPAAQRRAR